MAPRSKLDPNTLAVGDFLKHRNDKVWPTGSKEILPAIKQEVKGGNSPPADDSNVRVKVEEADDTTITTTNSNNKLIIPRRAKQSSLKELKAAYEEHTHWNFNPPSNRKFKNSMAAFNEIEDLRYRNTELGQENTELKQENTELKQENTELKQENTELKQENTELKQENTELKQENAKLHDTMEKMRQLLNGDDMPSEGKRRRLD